MKQAILSIWRWFDTSSDTPAAEGDESRVDWLRVVPFIGLHVTAIVGLFLVGWSWVAVSVAAALYAIRMFAITGFYHRYFSHKTFRTSRPMQFLMAIVGASSVQRGPLWWAAHHRNHHRHSDTAADVHSPVTRSFWYSHMGWFLTRAGFRTDWTVIPDLRKFWELKLVDRFDVFIAIGLAWLLFWLGGYLGEHYPELGTSRSQMLIWGFFVSTVVLFHCTVTINSLAHKFGRRRYKTRDDSRNNWFLAIITFGEGWHNNHHHFPGSARQGFFWWEYDLTFYILKVMSWFGLVWDLKPVPAEFRQRGRIQS
ncbi:MAG: acyl-CoA desaturase [Ahniella sp.]|nr:acyl-CoA desaturase [Ahniella sp.]